MPYAELCRMKYRGCVCTFATGTHKGAAHQCICGQQWVTEHPYKLDPNASTPGACWCMRPMVHYLHRGPWAA